MLEQGRPCKLLRIDHENNKIKGVYHLPTDHSSDIMVVVVEASALRWGFFVCNKFGIIYLQQKRDFKKEKRRDLYGDRYENNLYFLTVQSTDTSRAPRRVYACAHGGFFIC